MDPFAVALPLVVRMVAGTRLAALKTIPLIRIIITIVYANYNSKLGRGNYTPTPFPGVPQAPWPAPQGLMGPGPQGPVGPQGPMGPQEPTLGSHGPPPMGSHAPPPGALGPHFYIISF